MAGMQMAGPTPWWQQPSSNVDIPNLEKSAPSGYMYDKVKAQYVPQVGSAPDELAQRARGQGIEDRLLNSSIGGLNAANGSPFSLAPASSYGSPGGEGGGMGGAGGAAHSTAPSWQSITGPAQATQDAQESAVYGKVKDNAANTAQAAMRGLNENLQSRGMSGGGYEGGNIGATLGRESNQIGEGVRQWAGQRYADENHRADVNTQAGLTARGQDLGSATTERGQDLGSAATARGQDLSLGEANIAAGTARRGQDIGRLNALSGLTRSMSY